MFAGRLIVRFTCFLVAAAFVLAGQASAQQSKTSADEPPSARYISGSTVKLEQLIGDFDKERKLPTPNRTFARFSVLGTDLGYSFEHDGHAYFLFGDTLGHVSYAEDTMAMTDSTDPEKGVRLEFLTERKGKYMVMAPPGIRMDGFEVPVGGISLHDRMFIIVRTNHSQTKDDDWSHDRTVLTRFEHSGKFPVLRTISKRPAGQFMTLSLHRQVKSHAALPPGGPFVFLWGTGEYRKSDLYLQLVPAKHFASGEGTVYFGGLDPAGAPRWVDKEARATPVLKNGAMGDVSVTWCNDLSLWLMTYDSTVPSYGVWFRCGRTPWGPWSEPQPIFKIVRDHARGKYIHSPESKPPDGLAGPVIGKDKKDWEAENGGFYAPYVIERFTKVVGKELTIYYCLSTWNPYTIVLVRSRLEIGGEAPAPTPTPTKKRKQREQAAAVFTRHFR